MKRVFLLVLDSFGVGEALDADFYGDEGANTLRSILKTGFLDIPNMQSLGLFNLEGLPSDVSKLAVKAPMGAFAKVLEISKGKDTTTGHWEIAGVVTEKAFPTYPNGFPQSIIKEFSCKVKRGVICNRPYSGTKVINDYGRQHIETGDLIVYTSADSVFQIAAHEDVLDLEELYSICKVAREILVGENLVSRVIARPFEGEYPNFVRTKNRKDFSVAPPHPTMLDLIYENNLEVISVGKISDIFANRGITKKIKTKSNEEGLCSLEKCLEENFEGLCFVNLVDFDMIYGHRNDAKGYALALNFFDKELGKILPKLKNEDVLIITADHGCDPGDISTDHTREYVPLLVYGQNVKNNINLRVLRSFSCISATVLDYFNLKNKLSGQSFLNAVLA